MANFRCDKLLRFLFLWKIIWRHEWVDQWLGKCIHSPCLSKHRVILLQFYWHEDCSFARNPWTMSQGKDGFQGYGRYKRSEELLKKWGICHFELVVTSCLGATVLKQVFPLPIMENREDLREMHWGLRLKSTFISAYVCRDVCFFYIVFKVLFRVAAWQFAVTVVFHIDLVDYSQYFLECAIGFFPVP